MPPCEEEGPSQEERPRERRSAYGETKAMHNKANIAKLAAVTSAVAFASAKPAAALAESEVESASQKEVKRIRTACRGCGKMECGVWVTVENGRAVKIEGDESGVSVSGKLLHEVAGFHRGCVPSRPRSLPHETHEPKGEDDPGWVRISWDEAFQTTVEKAREVQERYGGTSIAGITGTSRVWPMAGTAGWVRMWGSPNGIQAWQVCKGPRHFTGNLVSQFAHSWVATVDRPRVYTAWGDRLRYRTTTTAAARAWRWRTRPTSRSSSTPV